MWTKSYFTHFDQMSWWWRHPYKNCGHFVNRYSGICSVSYGLYKNETAVILRNLYKNETAVILKCIDQLWQNLARLHNLVSSLDTNHKKFKFVYSFYCFYCFLSFFYCPSFVLTLMVLRGTIILIIVIIIIII